MTLAIIVGLISLISLLYWLIHRADKAYHLDKELHELLERQKKSNEINETFDRDTDDRLKLSRKWLRKGYKK